MSVSYNEPLVSAKLTAALSDCLGVKTKQHYRKRGSASYIVREVLSVRERERERERERDGSE